MNNFDIQNKEINHINDTIQNGTLDELIKNIDLLNKIGGPQDFKLTEVKKDANMIQKGIGGFFSFMINTLTSYHLNKALNKTIPMNHFALLAAKNGKIDMLNLICDSDLVPVHNRPNNQSELIEHLFANHHFQAGFNMIEKEKLNKPEFSYISEQNFARIAESKLSLNDKINYFDKLLDMKNNLSHEQSCYILNQAAREDTNFSRVLLEHPRFSNIFNKIEVKEKMFPHFIEHNQLSAMSWSLEQKHSTLYDDNCLAFIWAFNFKKPEVLNFLFNHESMDLKSAGYAISYYQENKHFSPEMYDLYVKQNIKNLFKLFMKSNKRKMLLTYQP